MRYRRESRDGDYTFGGGDNNWLVNAPETVAQAINTRLALWYGEWFLDASDGTRYLQSVLGKHGADAYTLTLRDRITSTPGVVSLLSFDSVNDSNTRRVTFTATVDTLYGQTTVTREA
nr:hypothetical protein [uncultured Enterobacter sp.]